MTLSRVRTDAPAGALAGRLFVWFTDTGHGPATLLMVPTRTADSGTVMVRPLIAATLEQANTLTPLAEAAAADLGCEASLREYQLTAVADLDARRAR